MHGQQNIKTSVQHFMKISPVRGELFNPLALELEIYSLAHHLCKKCEYFMNQEG